MQRIISIKQGLQKGILALGMLVVLLGSLFILSTPVYAATSEELKLIPPNQKLTPEEKIERAYDLGEGAGFLEEIKQESGNEALINPKAKPNVKSVKSPQSVEK